MNQKPRGRAHGVYDECYARLYFWKTNGFPNPSSFETHGAEPRGISGFKTEKEKTVRIRVRYACAYSSSSERSVDSVCWFNGHQQPDSIEKCTCAVPPPCFVIVQLMREPDNGAVTYGSHPSGANRQPNFIC